MPATLEIGESLLTSDTMAAPGEIIRVGINGWGRIGWPPLKIPEKAMSV